MYPRKLLMFKMYSATLILILVIPKDQFVNAVNLEGNIFLLQMDNFTDPYQIDLYERVPMQMKILNGLQADRFDFPYQAALYIFSENRRSFCGGSIISPKYVITAAHCMSQIPKRIIAVLGNEHLAIKNKYEQRIDVERYIEHAKYNSKTLKNDICLLHLQDSIKYNDATAPISLPKYEDAHTNYINKIGIASGFGKIQDDGDVMSDLMYTHVRVMDNLICSEAFEDKDWGHSNICTTGKDHKGPCHGDSGGPLVIKNKLVGIVSFGGKFCSDGYPIVYTRVPMYLEWIAHNAHIEIDD